RMNRQTFALAELQQTQCAIQVGTGEQDPFDRGAAVNAVGQQRREGLDLGRQVRRGVEQEPAPAVGTDGGAALRPRPGPRGLGPSQAAVDAATVPLRETATGRGAQQTYAHARIPRLTPRAVARRL